MESKYKRTPKEFSLSVIHVLPNCSPNLKKGLRDEFYKLNGRCEINRNKVALRDRNPLEGFYGSRINVEAIVGVNGSGKSSLFEIIYRVMFDAWGISIFVGFDFHNVDALRLKSRKELLTLLFRKLLILRIYSINIVCHNRCFLFMK